MHKFSNIVFLLLMFFPVMLSGQGDQKKTVVLINGIANEVILANTGDVLEILRTIPGYLPFKSKSLKQILDENPQYKIDDIFTSEVDLATKAESDDEQIVDKSVPEVRKGSGPPVLIEIASKREVYFDPKNAALNDEAIYKLNDIVAALHDNKDQNLHIRYSEPENPISLELARTRANAIRRYLEIRGVNSSQLKLVGQPGPLSSSVELVLD